MRHAGGVLLALCLGTFATTGLSQDPKAKAKADPAVVDSIVNRMMAFDKNKDGKLTREEITDPRLLRLFDRADADKDGVVTREELVALATEMAAEQGQGGGKGRRGPGGPDGPPDGPGGPPPGGPGGRGGFGFRGGPPRPGQILPPFLRDQLNLTDTQMKKVDALQKEVDSKLDKILTDAQKKQLNEMRKGRGGPPGGFGGPPPGGPDGPPPPPPDEREQVSSVAAGRFASALARRLE